MCAQDYLGGWAHWYRGKKRNEGKKSVLISGRRNSPSSSSPFLLVPIPPGPRSRSAGLQSPSSRCRLHPGPCQNFDLALLRRAGTWGVRYTNLPHSLRLRPAERWKESLLRGILISQGTEPMLAFLQQKLSQRQTKTPPGVGWGV